MVDWSLFTLERVIEDVILFIDSWDYPTNFMILKPKAKLEGYPLILGRPWLATANAHINCWSSNMIISNGEKTKELTLYPLAQPLLDTKDPTWVGSDSNDYVLVLTIKQV